VLVVDDDRNVCSALTRILSDAYKVRTAESGEEALAVIDQWVPDIVLADVLMPGIGGHGPLKAIRSHRAVGDIPVIMISGAVDEAVLGLDTGANDYFTKPFRPEHLRARVRAALSDFSTVCRSACSAGSRERCCRGESDACGPPRLSGPDRSDRALC
jgi:DNA-binding response OmpR family regulator